MNESESNQTWLGHPLSLSTLFFTELWERFSYYGMRALLVLFMVEKIQNGGMSLDDEMATAIYGLYTAFVYLACLPGGWMADRLLGDAGLIVKRSGDSNISGSRFDLAWFPVVGFLAALVLLIVLIVSGALQVNALSLAQHTTYVIVGLAVAFFVYLFVFGKLNPAEFKQTLVIVVLFISSAVFWSGFEQAGSSLNLFAERYTDRLFFGFEIPAGWFQSLGPLFIVTLAPVFASLWVRLATRQLDPSMPAKFALGLLLLGLGFLVMVGAAKFVVTGQKAAPYWLVLTYLIHTMGELCVSPVGLSSVTKLAPKRFMGQMMGIWFLATSLGNLIAGLMAGRFDPESLNEMPDIFLQIVLTTLGASVILFVCNRPIKKLMAHEG